MLKTLIIKYGIWANIFAEKMTYPHFFSKNTCELDILLTVTDNILTINNGMEWCFEKLDRGLHTWSIVLGSQNPERMYALFATHLAVVDITQGTKQAFFKFLDICFKKLKVSQYFGYTQLSYIMFAFYSLHSNTVLIHLISKADKKRMITGTELFLHEKKYVVGTH